MMMMRYKVFVYGEVIGSFNTFVEACELYAKQSSCSGYILDTQPHLSTSWGA